MRSLNKLKDKKTLHIGFIENQVRLVKGFYSWNDERASIGGGKLDSVRIIPRRNSGKVVVQRMDYVSSGNFS